MARVNIVKLVNIVKIVQNWCLGQGSPLPCSCYRPAAGATLQGLCRKGYAVWGYAAGAMLQESWIMADDDDGW